MALNTRAIALLVATGLVSGVTARLGFWQLDRAAQKQALEQALEARRSEPVLGSADLARDAAGAQAQAYRRVVVDGVWLARDTVYLDNRQMENRSGFYAVTPLRLADGSALLVQRGWLPRDPVDRRHIVLPPLPAGPVQVRGHLAVAVSRMFEFSAAASGAIRQNLHPAAYARETGLTLRPVVVVQDEGDASDGLLRHWPPPALNLQMNYGYAFQWFSMSVLALGLYAWFQIIRPRRRARR
ncbi:MAG: SURF1 family protein [Burkholderiales bacterium]|nr:SURF1 family protein [Burkholderiales bacterium]MDE1927840.1 SURF1 family protein [Burkholderiales bacterium]MDE2503313.1 SURF1 family protein [Burkholderiales bacterium]